MMRDLSKFYVSPSCSRVLLFSSQVILIGLFIESSLVSQTSADHISTHRRDEFRLVPKYKYSFHVRNGEGSQHGHHVHRNGPNTEGQYYVKLNNEGATQNVDYYTDQSGYHPKVVYTSNLDSSASRLGSSSSSSSPKPVFPGEANNFEVKKNAPNDTTNPSSPSPDVPAKEAESASPYSHTVKFRPSAHPSEVVFNTGYQFGAPPTISNENLTFFPEASVVLGSDHTPILFPAAPADAHLHPELNEISNSFLSKIVSVIPQMFASTRLLRPIIVSENGNISRKIDSANATVPADQALGPAQIFEYGELLADELKSNNARSPKSHNESGVVESKKSAEPSVEVLVEPQTLEEQAVITTTLDIAKSLPLAVNFVPDVDNHIQEPAANYSPADNGFPPAALPPFQFLSQPNPFLFPSPPTPVFPSRLPFPPPPLYASFQYIPIPMIHHQPNIIPLNLANEHLPSAPPPDAARELASSANLIEAYSNDTPVFQPPHEFPEQRKQIKYRSIVSQPPVQLSHSRRPHPPHAPHAAPVSPTHLIPYVKQVTNSPHTYAQYLAKHRAGEHGGPVAPHSVAYNVKYFPSEGTAAKSAPPKSSAPFKPSHPVWDSIYPPSHMYYVPYYVYDKVPPSGDRKARDSSSKRNHRYLRRLYVEYGGFKPPMVPSTLIEQSEGDSTEKQEVPKEKAATA